MSAQINLPATVSVNISKDKTIYFASCLSFGGNFVSSPSLNQLLSTIPFAISQMIGLELGVDVSINEAADLGCTDIFPLTYVINKVSKPGTAVRAPAEEHKFQSFMYGVPKDHEDYLDEGQMHVRDSDKILESLGYGEKAGEDIFPPKK